MCDKGWVFELGEGEMGAGVKIGKMYRLFKLLQKMDQRILLLTRFNKMYSSHIYDICFRRYDPGQGIWVKGTIFAVH